MAIDFDIHIPIHFGILWLSIEHNYTGAFLLSNAFMVYMLN